MEQQGTNTQASEQKTSRKLAGLHAPNDVAAGTFLAEATVPAEDARQRLLSFMVHEIRNPLASALWSAEMLARQQAGDSRQQRMAQLAARSVRRLRALLEDLFAMERLPIHAVAGTCDLRAAVDKALTPHELEPNGLKATVEGPTGLDIGLDPAPVDRLLHSCLRRATHAGSGEGAVSVTVSREESNARVSIRREGATLMEVDPPVLSPGGSEGAGTTFALMLARVAAHRLGVMLWVEPVEGGTTIHLRFPLKQ